jgi:hypothetical protein
MRSQDSNESQAEPTVRRRGRSRDNAGTITLSADGRRGLSSGSSELLGPVPSARVQRIPSNLTEETQSVGEKLRGREPLTPKQAALDLEAAHRVLDELEFPIQSEHDQVLSLTDRLMRFVRPLHKTYSYIERTVRRYYLYYDPDAKSSILIDQIRRRDGTYSFTVRNDLQEFATSDGRWLPLEDSLSPSQRFITLTRFPLVQAIRIADEWIEDLERRKKESQMAAAASA